MFNKIVSFIIVINLICIPIFVHDHIQEEHKLLGEESELKYISFFIFYFLVSILYWILCVVELINISRNYNRISLDE